MHYTVPAFLALLTVENSSLASFYINLTILILSSYPFTYPSGSYNYNSITICKQISTPTQPYQKIPHIYFLRSCPLPNLISILSLITIQFVFDVFVLYVLCNFYCTALLWYLVLWPQSWINCTTTTTTTTTTITQSLCNSLLFVYRVLSAFEEMHRVNSSYEPCVFWCSRDESSFVEFTNYLLFLTVLFSYFLRSLNFLPCLFTFLLVYFLTYLATSTIGPLGGCSIFRPEVVGGHWTWL